MKMKLWNKIFNLLMMCGLILFVFHSLLVWELWHVSRRNIELGVLWPGLQTMDFPISILMDRFIAIYGRLTEIVYPNEYLTFHFIFGGAQFFFFGFLIGIGYEIINIRNKYKFYFIALMLIIILIFSIYGFIVCSIALLVLKKYYK
jgi:hypothetical protein